MLYDEARDRLSDDELSRLDSWCAECAQQVGSDASGDGSQILENVKNEQHFSGTDGDAAAPDEYALFLQRLASDRMAGASFCDHFKTHCTPHRLEGTHVDPTSLPEDRTLFRYATFDQLRAQLDRVTRGRAPRSRARLEDEISSRWDSFWRKRFAKVDMHYPGVSVFAAVPPDSCSPYDACGGSAEECFAKLGLTRQPTERFELAYRAGAVSNRRTPTVADAGWFAYFRPAPAGSTMGMTCHRVTREEGFPEVVHAVRDMGCVEQEPRAVHD
jgi:hypothetical protein